MFRVASAFSVIAFAAWILPLGAFIRPSQEKTACDGKRAFHMCSMMKGSAQKQSAGVSLQSASGVEKGAKASSGPAGDDFLLKNRKLIFGNSSQPFLDPLLLVPSSPILYRLDAVPKI